MKKLIPQAPDHLFSLGDFRSSSERGTKATTPPKPAKEPETDKQPNVPSPTVNEFWAAVSEVARSHVVEGHTPIRRDRFPLLSDWPVLLVAIVAGVIAVTLADIQRTHHLHANWEMINAD